jgi:uncharacterized membrane protein
VQALAELNTEGSVDVYAVAVVQKDAQGWVATKKIDSDFPIRTLAGTAIGGLIGLLGGPAGVVAPRVAGSVKVGARASEPQWKIASARTSILSRGDTSG